MKMIKKLFVFCNSLRLDTDKVFETVSASEKHTMLGVADVCYQSKDLYLTNLLSRESQGFMVAEMHGLEAI